MSQDPLQRTRDELDWHNRKTCRSGPDYGADPDKARDHDQGTEKPVRQSSGPTQFPDTIPCPCGGVAVIHLARSRGDTHLSCSNVRVCDRLVPIPEGRRFSEAVEIWNREVERDRKEMGL